MAHHLIVTHLFTDPVRTTVYAVGARVTDPDEVESILAGPNAGRVVRVAAEDHDPEPPPTE